MNRRHVQVLKQAVREAGAEVLRIAQGGKHLKVYCRKGDKARMVVAPVSPSDWRWLMNLKRDLRRELDPPRL